ncbi:MAG: DegT/DnrJ/EryC1/StrS family aminotransferase [Flavobacteriales bacterium]
MKIPFVDLKAQYLSIQNEIDTAIRNVINETAFISGGYATRFEADFSKYIGLPYVIACANGTDSLEILLQAMGIGPGDEVIVPAISWISTSEAVSAIGAKPVFVDVDEHNLIDLDLIESAITARTKAIIPVHLYGNPVNMPRVMSLAERFGLKVLEDCAQSHGAEIQGKLAGTFGHAASFSFYPGKNLGAYGDAGGMATADAAIAKKARAIANHGQEGKHNHIMEGRNSRMDGIQAAVLSVKIPHLPEWTEKRIKNAALYDQYLDSRIQKPKVNENGKHVYHLYVIRHPKRDALAAYLKEAGIETSIHYPTPLPLMPCYTEDPKAMASTFSVAAKASSEILSLPMYAELSEMEIRYIAEKVNEFNG